MARYKNRKLTLLDLINKSQSPPAYDFLGMVQMIKDDSLKYFEEFKESNEKGKWETECNKLLDFMHYEYHSDDLLGKINQFIEKFEHAEKRMHQILYSSKIGDEKRDKYIDQLTTWMNIIFRTAIKAFVDYELKK